MASWSAPAALAPLQLGVLDDRRGVGRHLGRRQQRLVDPLDANGHGSRGVRDGSAAERECGEQRESEQG